MDLYSLYDSDPDLEEGGIIYQAGDAKFKLARAGGANKAFTTYMTRALRPYKQQLQRGRLDEKTSRAIMAKGYSLHVCRSWENVTDREGDLIPFSPEAFIDLMEAIPELFEDIIAAAGDVSNYVQDERETTAKT